MTAEPKNERLELELASFRQQWHDELSENTVQGQDEGQTSSADGSHDYPPDTVEEQAAKIFLRGVELEQQRRMHEAVLHYKKAMRLVPDIEIKVGTTAAENAIRDDVDDEQTNVGKDEKLADMIMQFQNIKLESPCEREWSSEATHISILPSELLIGIFRWVISDQLDIRSLENLSLVCKWFYICARDSGIWKQICLRIWSNFCPRDNDLDWHTYYLTNLHPQYDGVYISTMSYIRQGEKGLDGFYRPYHFVEHYRYMRFYPNGAVLVLTTPMDPPSVVSLMHFRNCNQHGISRGRYRLSPGKLNILLKKKLLKDGSVTESRRRRREVVIQPITEHVFHMELNLSTTKRHKRRHQLDWVQYSCDVYNLSSGQSCSSEFDLSDFRPLVFSRVKSYVSQSLAPL